MPYIDTKYLFECETCRHHLNGKCNTWCDHGEEYIPVMTKIPTADVEEVKHGEWIEEEHGMFYSCSNCGYLIEYQFTNYCPNCGAKKDGQEDEEG